MIRITWAHADDLFHLREQNYQNSEENKQDSRCCQKYQECFEILDRGDLLFFDIGLVEEGSEYETDSVDVVEAHEQGHQDEELNEREEDIAEGAAEQIGLREREMSERRGDDENEATTKYLSQDDPHSC